MTLTDHTYSDYESSRRLRALGGGLRRILLIVKGCDEDLTNKQIIKDLEYSIILGSKDKLVTQIYAIEGIRITQNVKTLS